MQAERLTCFAIGKHNIVKKQRWDFMEFITISFAKSQDAFPVPSWVKKMPSPVLHAFRSCFHPQQKKDCCILGVQGHHYTLPFLESESMLAAKEVGSIESKLDIDHTVVLLPDSLAEYTSCQRMTGQRLCAFYLLPAIEKLLRILEKELSYAKFLIISGENFLTRLAVDCLYPHINYLCIYTPDEKGWEDKAEEMFEESGLETILFSQLKSHWLKEADVIINIGQEMSNNDYVFPRSAIYFDLAQNKKKMERLLRKREDLLAVDGIRFHTTEGYLGQDMAEAVECCRNFRFYDLFLQPYSTFRLRQIQQSPDGFPYVISSFTSLGQCLTEERKNRVISRMDKRL